jgi:type I restriction enzyme S subunit
MSRYKPYPAYKDSGVEWLGEVPTGWSVLPLKRVAETRLSNVDKLTVEGQQPVRLCNYVDVYNNERITAGMEFMAATASDDQIRRLSLRAGDVLITKDSETPDDIGVPAVVVEDMDGVVCGYHLALLRPAKEVSAGKYLARLLQSSYVCARFATSAVGLTRYGLGKYDIENVLLPAPPGEDQAAVAAFLDRETAKLDALIAKQERLIALLREKRQALISHAVTKGLNPDVPMKDSGIEWLGQVPAHWDILRLGILFRELAEAGDGELPILQVSIHDGVSDREFEDEELSRKITRSDDRSKYKKVLPGDLVYNMMRAWQGAFGAVTVSGMVSPAYVVARPRAQIRTDFVEQLLRTPQAVETLRSRSYGVADFRLRLYWDKFKAIEICLPPLGEQERIMEAIAKAVGQIDELSAKSLQSIALMREHRTALISAAVTGKIDVRDAA